MGVFLDFVQISISMEPNRKYKRQLAILKTES
jgi:hypothetical protein